MGLHSSRHRNRGWLSQYERTHRWFERVARIGTRQTQSADTEHEHDTLVAFFHNCYHLRDWLLNDKAVAQKDLEDLFKSHIELRVCQDICNGTKHLDLDHPKVDGSFSIGREYVDLDDTRDRPHLTETWFIVAGSEKYDLFELAAACMRIWDTFVGGQGLV